MTLTKEEICCILRVQNPRVRACVPHEKDEFDIIFTDCGNLSVCECKDKTVGQRDIYVLAMKVDGINETLACKMKYPTSYEMLKRLKQSNLFKRAHKWSVTSCFQGWR